MVNRNYLAFISIIFSGIFFTSCSTPSAEKIIDRSIAFYGMEKLENADVAFDFRQFHYQVSLKNGRYKYERSFTDSTGNKVHDVLTNKGLVREVNNMAVKLNNKEDAAYTESVNATVYFVYLPLKLNDPAVQKKLLGQVKIGDKEYYKIEISFSKQDGGKDYDDIYYYWFDTEDYSMDHLAYSTGGNRFRQVLKLHEVDGVRFQDYINYERPKNDSVTALIQYDSLYQANKLPVLSRIELKNIRVSAGK